MAVEGLEIGACVLRHKDTPQDIAARHDSAAQAVLDLQGRGYGRQLMRHAEEWLKGQGVWKLNLLLRADNEKIRAFYEALGYEVEPRLCMARRLID